MLQFHIGRNVDGIMNNKVRQGRYGTKRNRRGKIQTGSVTKEKLDEIGSRAELSPRKYLRRF
jgi:hypothetical protein